MTDLSVLLLGFFLGLRHALDPDHVIAVTTMVAENRSVRAGVGVGARWGIGHAATLLLAGGVLLSFRLTLSAHVGLALEFAVAAMLIALGVRSVRRTTLAGHHVVLGASPDDAMAWRARARPLVVGAIHGLSGSAAFALMVLATIRDGFDAIVYLLVFAVGTTSGMIALTSGLSLPLAWAVRKNKPLQRIFMRGAGAVSIAIGVYLAYRVGFVDGLFSTHPRWTPS